MEQVTTQQDQSATATNILEQIRHLKSLVAALEARHPKIADSGINRLLDTLIVEQGLRNDAALSRKLKLAPTVISKLRHGRSPLGSTIILAIHENIGMPVARIRELAA